MTRCKNYLVLRYMCVFPFLFLTERKCRLRYFFILIKKLSQNFKISGNDIMLIVFSGLMVILNAMYRVIDWIYIIPIQASRIISRPITCFLSIINCFLSNKLYWLNLDHTNTSLIFIYLPIIKPFIKVKQLKNHTLKSGSLMNNFVFVIVH